MSDTTKTAVGQKDDLLLLEPKYFGPFWKYVEQDDITDVDFNGTDLWITDTKNRRQKIEDHGITADFVYAFSQRVANQVSKPFNQKNNLLEAETKTLRISVIHESAAVSGRSICIRKTLPNVRITAKGIVEDSYMPRPIMNLLTNCIKAKMNVVIGGEPGAGKDLADDTPVPVPVSEKYPDGWAKHGDLQPGDFVYAPDGSIAEIDYVTPGRDLDLYEVEFSDGQVIKASDTHLWRVSTHKARRKEKVNKEKRYRTDAAFEREQKRLRDMASALAGSMSVADAKSLAVYTGTKPATISKFMRKVSVPSVHLPGRGSRLAWPTDEALLAWADHLAENYYTNASRRTQNMVTLSTKELAKEVVVGDGRLNWAVEVPNPITGDNLSLPMDPYTLGVWLGDGHSYGGQITIFDPEIEERLKSAGFVRVSASPTGQAQDVTFENLWHALCNTLTFVSGKKNKLDKRIPAIYLRASYVQRLALLQGLMDADGTIDKKGRCELCFSKKDLTLDALELIRSMGIKAQMHDGPAAMTLTDKNTGEKTRQECGIRYRIHFTTTVPVFSITRKADRLPKQIRPTQKWNYITAIRHVKPEHGKCIHVAHPEHLYLAGGFIPTHNTECAKFLTQFVPLTQRVITIEDSPEWHFHEINPYHDCVELRVNPDFDYAKAIKTCLRQNPKWIMLSEARSVEVKYLIESWSTGVNGVTTIHTDDVRKIASRLLNMMANRDDADRLENDIYDFVNVVMLVRRKALADGSAHRYIDQMGFFYREGKENKVRLLVKNGEMVCDVLPDDIAFRLSRESIEKPFESEELDKLVGNPFTYTYMEHPLLEQDPVTPAPAPVVQYVTVPQAVPAITVPVSEEPKKETVTTSEEVPSSERSMEPEADPDLFLEELDDGLEGTLSDPEEVLLPKSKSSAASRKGRMHAIGSVLNKRGGAKAHANG